MTEPIEVRVFTKLVEDGEIVEIESGRWRWTDEPAARAKYKRFHGDPVKFCAYLAADVEKVADISQKVAELTGELENLAKINGSLTAIVNNKEAEIASLTALLKDERERRTMAEIRLQNVHAALNGPLDAELFKLQRPAPPNLDSPFYRELAKFGHLAMPKIAVELRNFTAKRVESPDPEKIVLDVNAEVYYNGNIGISRSVNPGDYVRGRDGQVWQIIAPMTDAESIKKFGVKADGKRVIGYKELEDKP